MKTINSFKDLEFEFIDLEDSLHIGVRCRVQFPNGYGASIVRHNSSYGNEEGLYELAVLGKDGELHFDNPVANGDVRGYLSEDDVTKLIKEIQQL
jgi:hypothetical protein